MMDRKRALITLVILFVISIAIRLPNLNRPISKHHEFNTAVVLINIESWRQAGGGSVFHYTPLMNFQNPGDKHFDTGPHIDPQGNHLYLSYGPGWYILPYFFYQLFRLPAQPVYLQVLNLLISFLTLLLLFRLFEQLVSSQLSKKYWIVCIGCGFFLFAPSILWYLGNGYVNIGIMLPLVVTILLYLLPMLQSPSNITPKNLLLLGLFLIVLAYFDWFGFFLSAAAGFFALARVQKEKKYTVLLFTLVLANVAGIAAIFFQFASYAGSPMVAHYWTHRFGERSISSHDESFLVMMKGVAQHLFTSYLPLLLIIAAGYSIGRLQKTKIVFSRPEKIFIQVYALTILLYNSVLLNWTADHEFSLIPLGILLAYLAGRFVMQFNGSLHRRLLVLFCVTALVQYFFINRPGPVSREGTPYKAFRELGGQLKKIPADQPIFMDIEPNPMVEYYAGRNITPITDSVRARTFMRQWKIPSAAWVNQNHYELQSIALIH